MLLTTCPACAAPLAHDAPRCVRCQTRYCNKTCQHDHWRRGHKQMCKKIHRGGNAEQYFANEKYKEAVAVAVKKCADDTKGQKCYICLEAVHARTGEGLVRGCACGDRDGVSSPELGVAHLTCLARQAKEGVEDAWENNVVGPAFNERWKRWHTCSLCEQSYHGVVRRAIGWACWKTYVGLPEYEERRKCAMGTLANGLSGKGQLHVRECELDTARRIGVSELDMFLIQSNVATSYSSSGRIEDAIEIHREVYSGRSKLLGEEHCQSLTSACNLASCLIRIQRFKEGKALYRKVVPVARRTLGDSHDLTLRMRRNYAGGLYGDDGATLDELHESVTTFEEIERIAHRALGSAHPLTKAFGDQLQKARAALRAREETQPPGGA